jgi:signal transduction histidine kinase
MGHGILGGSLKSQQKQTVAVAELALHVLRGDNPDNLPVKSQSLQVNQVDWRQLQRWKISESRLPPDTLVLFREATVWERYKLYVLIALSLVLAQTALIAGLLLQSQRRRQAEEQVRGSRAALQTSYDRIRTLGVRLLNAQDSERARIARELHDDVSQQLALLSIDIDLLRGANPSDSTGLAVQAWDRTQTIARSVHDLAYRLYPAKLRLIGLLPALEALKPEMGRAGIVMNVSHENVPASLPPDVTLCIFRIVQEALQNVIKYSGAREVTMSLGGTSDGLALTIADDGVGFDVGSAWGKGLGLASMSERVEAMKGTFQIRSAPGRGTRIEIGVPVADVESIAAAG